MHAREDPVLFTANRATPDDSPPPPKNLTMGLNPGHTYLQTLTQRTQAASSLVSIMYLSGPEPASCRVGSTFLEAYTRKIIAELYFEDRTVSRLDRGS